VELDDRRWCMDHWRHSGNSAGTRDDLRRDACLIDALSIRRSKLVVRITRTRPVAASAARAWCPAVGCTWVPS